VQRRPSPNEQLAADLAAADVERCGFTCEHHAPLTCKRAAGHQQAEDGLMVDMHADLVDGQPRVFDDLCERHADNGETSVP